jgi:hypothetical protein
MIQPITPDSIIKPSRELTETIKEEIILSVNALLEEQSSFLNKGRSAEIRIGDYTNDEINFLIETYTSAGWVLHAIDDYFLHLKTFKQPYKL